MTSKYLVAGVKRIYGESKAGNDFDMCAVKLLLPIEGGHRQKITIEGVGNEEVEMPCAPEAVAAFLPYRDQLAKGPVELELLTEQRRERGEFRTVVTGVVPPLRNVANK